MANNAGSETTTYRCLWSSGAIDGDGVLRHEGCVLFVELQHPRFFGQRLIIGVAVPTSNFTFTNTFRAGDPKDALLELHIARSRIPFSDSNPPRSQRWRIYRCATACDAHRPAS